MFLAGTQEPLAFTNSTTGKITRLVPPLSTRSLAQLRASSLFDAEARICNHRVLMSPSSQEIVRSYRILYRHALHAVQYAAPARHTLRVQLENAYRTGNAADFDAQKVNNTVTFLEGAAKEKGLEHKILKSLLHTWFWDVNARKRGKRCVLRRHHARTLC